MSEKENSKRKGCSSPVVLFFVLAILCVAAFLIVILVKSCDADHEEKVEEQMLEQPVSMVTKNNVIFIS